MPPLIVRVRVRGLAQYDVVRVRVRVRRVWRSMMCTISKAKDPYAEASITGI